MASNVDKGRYGENLAIEYLKAKGYRIQAENYRTKLGEIDIIASVEGCIVFIEVKYRANLQKGYPREAVTVAKQNKIKKTALSYVTKEDIVNIDMRFDVIEILEGSKITITHLENAFY